MNTSIKIAATKPKWCLCQDCLLVLPNVPALSTGEEKCECGGDLCNCPNCIESIEDGYCYDNNGNRHEIKKPGGEA